MENPAPVLHCPTCYHTEFRISRLRPEDRLQQFLFRLPVRCKNCRARIYAPRSYVKWLRTQATTAPA